jgi:hypothetical protein
LKHAFERQLSRLGEVLCRSSSVLIGAAPALCSDRDHGIEGRDVLPMGTTDDAETIFSRMVSQAYEQLYLGKSE